MDTTRLAEHVGENNLGKILMLVRHEIREEAMKGFARGTV